MNDQKTANILKYIFIVLCITELAAEMMALEVLVQLTKPLLMPVLLVYMRKSTTGPISLSLLLAAAALIFSFVGDSVLMYASLDEMYFLIGLGAFAVAQLFYVFSFSKAVNTNIPPLSNILKILYSTPFLIYSVVFISLIWDGIGALKIPVSIYTALIMSMALSAVYRQGRADRDGVNQVIFGAILFVLSDSLIAINKFYAPMENARFFIMLTYILAQWNIVNGLVKHYNK